MTETGKVTRCRVIQSLPGMDDHLVKTFEQRRYRPATCDGKLMAVAFTFKLEVKPPW